MAGLMEMLFGPDGVGGQPGLAGKAGDLLWKGTGELSPDAGLGETVAKSLGNIPHLVTDIAFKNPIEILKNPMSALNDNGEVSITRLLFPDFRRARVAADEQAADSARMDAQLKVLKQYGDIASQVMGAPTAEAQDAIRAGYEGLGADPALLDPFNLAGHQQRQAARAAAAEAGLPAAATNIADVDMGQKAALRAQQTVEQMQAQQNQANLSAGNIALRDRLARSRAEMRQQPPAAADGAAPLPSTVTERRDMRSVIALRKMLRKGEVPENLRPLARVAARTGDGRVAQQVLSQTGYNAMAGAPSKVFASPMFREAATSAQEAADLLDRVRATEELAVDPTTGTYDRDLFSRGMAAMLPSDPQAQSVVLSALGAKGQRKQQLISSAEDLLSSVVVSRTGKTANQTEMNRLRLIGPTGNEATPELFAAKIKAVNEAFERERILNEERAKRIGRAFKKGNTEEAVDSLFSERYRSNMNQLIRDLEKATTDPGNFSDEPLSDEEKAKLPPEVRAKLGID